MHRTHPVVRRHTGVNFFRIRAEMPRRNVARPKRFAPVDARDNATHMVTRTTGYTRNSRHSTVQNLRSAVSACLRLTTPSFPGWCRLVLILTLWDQRRCVGLFRRDRPPGSQITRARAHPGGREVHRARVSRNMHVSQSFNASTSSKESKKHGNKND